MKERIEELRKIINEANYDYYILDNPTLSDQEYDRYLNELIDLEEKNPEFIIPTSPTQIINVNVNTPFEKVTHSTPMLSLGNVFNESEIINFDKRIKKEIKNPKYTCELKIDGLAVSIVYKNGIFTKAATRGNGIIGEDITHNVSTIKSLPKKLPEKIDVEIRGEIFMSKKTFESLNEERKESDQALFANPRNAAAGSVRQLDCQITASRNLDCFLYHYINSSFDSHFESLEYLKRLGIPVDEHIKKFDNIEQVMEYIDYWSEHRNNLAYEIDGVVIKVDNFNDQQKLGFTSKYPKWATAYKFKALEAMTKVKDIIFTVGRTGQVTPNALLEPVLVAGSVVSKTTLHNEEYVNQKDIKINDMVLVRKAGDVIPEVVRVITEKRTGDEIDFKMIVECPICHQKLQKFANNAAFYCTNEDCDARVQESLIHFASREAMNIEGFGERIIEDFYNWGFIRKIEDFYDLHEHKNQLISLNRFGDKSVANLLENIENSKSNSLEKLLFAIGIRQVGSKTAKVLASHFGDIDNLIKAKVEDLQDIRDVGPIIADNIVRFFNDDKNLQMIDILKKHQVNMKYISNVDKTLKFSNMKFVLTGTLDNYSRDQAKKIIENFGGEIVESVSKNTSVVIVGDKPGSKFEKAQKLKIPIWNEEEFIKKAS